MSKKAWEAAQYAETVRQYIEYCESIGDVDSLKILKQFEEAKSLFFLPIFIFRIFRRIKDRVPPISKSDTIQKQFWLF